jgi:hypothetical protein
MSANLAHARESEPGNWLVDGGDMGRLVRSRDWGATELGPIDFGPVSLRTTVNLCLASNSPLCVIRGTGLPQIYNDAYWPICGSKHPATVDRVLSKPPKLGQPREALTQLRPQGKDGH